MIIQHKYRTVSEYGAGLSSRRPDSKDRQANPSTVSSYLIQAQGLNFVYHVGVFFGLYLRPFDRDRLSPYTRPQKTPIMDGDIPDSQPSPTEGKAVMEKSAALDPEKQALEHKNVDAALEFLASEEIGIMTEVDEKKLVRKIDWRIMPLMCMSPEIFLRPRCFLLDLSDNENITKGFAITSSTSTRRS